MCYLHLYGWFTAWSSESGHPQVPLGSRLTSHSPPVALRRSSSGWDGGTSVREDGVDGTGCSRDLGTQTGRRRGDGECHTGRRKTRSPDPHPDGLTKSG